MNSEAIHVDHSSAHEDGFNELRTKIQSNPNVMGIDYGSPDHEVAKSLVETLNQDEKRRRLESSTEDDWNSDPYLYKALTDSVS